MKFTQYRDDFFSSTAIETAKRGSFSEAVEWSDGIENDSRRAETLLRIATRAAQDGDPVSARTIAGNTSFLTSDWGPLVSPPLSFDFDRPETWGRIYDPCLSAASCSAAFERARDLAAAAVGLQVALENTDWSAIPRAFSDVSPDVL